jgi:hypothetical protein
VAARARFLCVIGVTRRSEGFERGRSRHPLARETRHALYRARPERWLEALVCQDITRSDSALEARFVYPQIFARAGNDHGILDVLSVTRAGRLAILELKASEHRQAPSCVT